MRVMTAPTQRLTPSTAEILSIPGARLVVQKGPDRGRALKLGREETVVGSGPTADLQLTDETVSRSHFSLRVLPTGCLLTDLESSNGTFVEGRRIRSAYLSPGDKI